MNLRTLKIITQYYTPMKKIIFLLLLLFPVIIFSQTETKPKNIILTTSITQSFDNVAFANASLNLGIEHYLKKSKSLLVNVGLADIYDLFDPNVNMRGIRLQLEGRHYFKRKKIFAPLFLLYWPHIFQMNSQKLENTGYYLALNAYGQYSEKEINSFIGSELLSNRKAGLNIKFGFQSINKFGLVIDYAMGGGIGYNSTFPAEPQGYRLQGTNFLEEQNLGISFIMHLALGFGI